MRCPNCKDDIRKPRRFQDVVICDNCFKLASHYVKKTRTEMEMIFLTYTDMLRVALVKGELRPPPSPPDGTLPRRDFAEALQRLGANHATEGPMAEGSSKVHPLWDEAQDRLRQAHSGGNDKTIPRRRRVRQVQKVQTRGTTNR